MVNDYILLRSLGKGTYAKVKLSVNKSDEVASNDVNKVLSV